MLDTHSVVLSDLTVILQKCHAGVAQGAESPRAAQGNKLI